ncbi:MAG: tRNA pseudouridine(55) synthase TruB [Clostridia bacterium]|nr:tRNA pseudouridine(55) synthase TruB [Clostridia bacterium]
MTGIIPLNKSENITSFFAVSKIRRLAGEKKAGHTGTLDPNATGVLPVAMGGATRFIELLPTHKKAYKATFKTGIRTDTLDIWGNVTEAFEKKVTFRDVLKAAEGFKGEIMQLPPMYSALKKDGVRLYELARQGKEVERTPRKCEIYELIVGEAENGEYSIYCECSAGTYIRTLIDDIGSVLGTGAVMTSLQRTFACGVSIDECYTLEELAVLQEKGELEKTLIPVDKLLEFYPAVKVTDNQAVRFKNGGDLLVERVKGLNNGFGLYRVYGLNKFLGLGEYLPDSESLKVKRVYNEM